jgi:hypothetical protein
MQQEQAVSELKIKILLLREQYEKRLQHLKTIKQKTKIETVSICLDGKIIELKNVIADLGELLK